MSFTQPCFIRKNTPELRKKLEKLGYKPFGIVKNGFGLSTDELLGEYESINDSALENILKMSGTEDYKETIDCSDNEELFLALAALRDDNDYLQWFVSNKKEWILCEKPKWYQEHITTFGFREWHKATVEELIKHYLKNSKGIWKSILININNNLTF